MKNGLLYFSTLVLPLLVPAQVCAQLSTAQNYVATTTVLQVGVTTNTQLQSLPLAGKQQQVVYLDGLGRPIQQVQVQASQQGRDVVSPMAYDALGRTSVTYLPYAVSGSGAYQPSAPIQQNAFYQEGASGALNVAHDKRPYATAVFEASPLNRVVEQSAPGAAWQPGTGHTTKVVQRTNTSEESIRQWDYNLSNQTCSSSLTYAAGQLAVQETRDEQDQLVTNYTDKQGRLLLKKVSSAETTCAVEARGGTIELRAPTGMVITGIRSATWGVAVSGTNCNDILFDTDRQFEAKDYVQRIVSTSLGNRIISFTVDWTQLGPDPAPGQGKYLQVVATYAPALTTVTDLLTYYIYDDLGNLRVVIPPEGTNALLASGTWTPTTTFLNKWCFRYDYDGRRRMIEKQMPGAGPVRMAYNLLDQLVLQQDANQESQALWLFTKYDGLGRPIATGQWYEGRDQATLQAELNTQTVFAEQRDNTSVGYTLTLSYPQGVYEGDLLSITYYDDYSQPTLSQASRAFVAENGVADSDRSSAVRGQITGHSEKELESQQWLTTVQFYDAKYRVIQTQQDLYPTGTERKTSKIDFAGLVRSSLTTHDFPTVRSAAGISQHTVLQEFDYDQASRLTETRQQVDDQPKIILARQEYNEIGQLVDKKLHSLNLRTTGPATAFLQSVDYRYNIRGWLSNINNRNLSNEVARYNDADPNEDLPNEGKDLFGMELMYNAHQNLPGSKPQYNGNISEVMWQTKNLAITGNALRAYSYYYDGLSRISSAAYRAYGNGGWATNRKDFSVDGINYDANGNLQSMTRYGKTSAPGGQEAWGRLDGLTYTYDGNHLVAVDDLATTASTHDFHDTTGPYNAGSSSAEYTYDLMGSLVSDRNKGIIDITYNVLNKPSWIYLYQNNSYKYIRFLYSASGVKLQKHTWEQNPRFGQPGQPYWLEHNTDYAGGFVYEDNELKFAPGSEGRMLYTDNSASRPALDWKYEYHLRDHLGNLRIAFTDEGGNTSQKSVGMEPVNAPEEEQEFTHVAETRLRDATHARTGNYVAHLNAHTGRQQGPSIRLTVAAGDSVYAEVYGRYDHAAPVATLARKGAILTGSAVLETPGTAMTEQQRGIAGRRRWLPYIGTSVALVPQLLNLRRAPVPTAYLRYELFSQDSQLVATRTQPLQRSSADAWQQLSTGLRADRAGYVQVRLVNESGTPAYFDDLQLKTTTAVSLQENNYDPFGLNLVGIESSSGVDDSRYQYNGKEKQEDFGLNWMDYGARMYDAQLGRWHTVDPLAEKYAFITPYAYTLNNPIKYIDPDGRDPRIARNIDNNGNTTITVTTNIVLVNQRSQAVAQMRGLNAEAAKYLPTSSFSSGNGTTTTVKFISNVLVVGSEKEYKQLDKELSGATVRAEFNGKITEDQANYDGAVNFGSQLSARSLFHEIGHDFGFADKYLEDSQGYAAVLKEYVNTLMGTSSPLSNKEAQSLAAGAVVDGVYKPVNIEKDEVPVGSTVEVYKQSAGGGLESNATKTVARPGDGILNQTRKMSN